MKSIIPIEKQILYAALPSTVHSAPREMELCAYNTTKYQNFAVFGEVETVEESHRLDSRLLWDFRDATVRIGERGCAVVYNGKKIVVYQGSKFDFVSAIEDGRRMLFRLRALADDIESNKEEIAQIIDAARARDVLLLEKLVGFHTANEILRAV